MSFYSHLFSLFLLCKYISDCAFMIYTYLKTYLLRLWRRQIGVNPPVKLWCSLKRLLKSSICPCLQFHNSYNYVLAMRMSSVKNIYLYIYNSQLIKCRLARAPLEIW